MATIPSAHDVRAYLVQWGFGEQKGYWLEYFRSDFNKYANSQIPMNWCEEEVERFLQELDGVSIIGGKAGRKIVELLNENPQTISSKSTSMSAWCEKDAEGVLDVDLYFPANVPEGLDCCMDVASNPLWHAALTSSISAPEEFVQETAIHQNQLRCYSAAVLVITTNQELLLQERREGLQTFGGGKYRQALVCKAEPPAHIFFKSPLE